MKPTLVFDTEVYRDYFLASFRNLETGNVRHFELFDGQPFDAKTVRTIVSKYRLVTFNGRNFDLPVLAVALRGGSCEEIKRVADRIIKNNMKWWQLDIDPPECDHIDLIEVAPGIASLKIYGGRMHCQRMQDLPIEPDDSLAPEQRAQLRDYCGNDLSTTAALFRKLQGQIELREQMSAQYGVDLRSKSDAQVAEAVIRHEVEKRMKRKLEKAEPFRLAGMVFEYKPPRWLGDIQRGGALEQAMDTVCTAAFTVAGNGTVVMPKSIADLKIKIGDSTYRMGIGGLHSSEKSVAHHSDADNVLIDRDVASYYPAIILNCGLQPENMGAHFTAVYRGIVHRRLAAKAAGDKVQADSLKITINGSFGKFGSPYSFLYDPRLLIQVTVTGQLSLLMLIEMLEAEGIPVVSANTDGIVVKCPRSHVALMDLIVLEWETATGFTTEAVEYCALYSRDVNNFIALKADGGFKVKGAYAPPEIVANSWPNPSNQVSKDAAVEYLRKGTPIEQTVNGCRDITKFVTIRSVKGGAVKDGRYLGKAVRWYYALGELGTINYKLNGYTVPRTEGAKPCMDLPATFPDDVDLGWYIDEAYSILKDVGAPVEELV